MLPVHLPAKFLILVIGILSEIVIERESDLLIRKAAEHAGPDGGPPGLLRIGSTRGAPAFDGRGPRRVLPQIAQVFQSWQMINFTDDGEVPHHTDLFPLQNASECRRCHAKAGETLGVILISHSLEDTFEEIASSG